MSQNNIPPCRNLIAEANYLNKNPQHRYPDPRSGGLIPPPGDVPDRYRNSPTPGPTYPGHQIRLPDVNLPNHTFATSNAPVQHHHAAKPVNGQIYSYPGNHTRPANVNRTPSNYQTRPAGHAPPYQHQFSPGVPRIPAMAAPSNAYHNGPPVRPPAPAPKFGPPNFSYMALLNDPRYPSGRSCGDNCLENTDVYKSFYQYLPPHLSGDFDPSKKAVVPLGKAHPRRDTVAQFASRNDPPMIPGVGMNALIQQRCEMDDETTTMFFFKEHRSFELVLESSGRYPKVVKVNTTCNHGVMTRLGLAYHATWLYDNFIRTVEEPTIKWAEEHQKVKHNHKAYQRSVRRLRLVSVYQGKDGFCYLELAESAK